MMIFSNLLVKLPHRNLLYSSPSLLLLVKLKDTIDKCFTLLDSHTIQQSSQLLETTHQSLLKIIQQQSRNLIS